ncbi:hypothetical protein Pogu_2268 [Pyrobaculum oguniense TE7]|uniref:Uncharacterized protein n=1 Tax=Pyrobaculum oguniense (strain DSM 13380 / JCM 10595 / TE7) TaxID=698757 RepID=H6QD27_PYROT|nr:hypothetical protein Pogu_2268 [Pyrobaculum oguniense TE7]
MYIPVSLTLYVNKPVLFNSATYLYILSAEPLCGNSPHCYINSPLANIYQLRGV